MVLNAEMQSMNSILTQVFLLCRWERAVWSAIEIVICGSVWVVCELELIQGFWNDGVDVSHDQPFKAFHGYRYECYGAIVIQTDYIGVLGLRDYGGLLEHVGTTDLARERLKMSVKTLASCNSSGPVVL